MAETEADKENLSEEPASPAGFGERLRLARERCGWTVEEVADRLRLTIAVIECLEDESFAIPRTPAFYRGYLRSYALLVEEVPDEILKLAESKLPTEQTPQLQSMTGEVMATDAGSGGTRWKRVVGYLAFLGLVLVGAFAIWDGDGLSTGNPTVEDEMPASGARGELSLSIPSDKVEEDRASSNDSAPAAAEVSTPAEMSDVQDDLPADAEDDARVQAGANEASGRAGSDDTGTMREGVLELTFKGDCWVRISDATGEVLALGIKRQGKTIRLHGMAPFKLILGNAPVVEIAYNGEPVDLSGFPRGRRTELTLP